MKTPLQTLIERLENRKHVPNENDTPVMAHGRKIINIVLDDAIAEAKSLLEPEKQHIIDAANWYSKSISENGHRLGEKYFTETFKP